jgi:hypothetical protein
MTRRSAYRWLISLTVVGVLASPAVLSCGSNGAGGWSDAFSDDGSTGSSSGGGSGASATSSSGSTTSSSSSTGGGNSSGGSSSGSSTGSGSSGGSASGSSSGSSSGVRDAGVTSDHYVPNCGGPCDLLKNTCCLPGDGGADASYCLRNTTSASCGANVGTIHCGGVTDCPSGDVCCGTYNQSMMTADTVCQRPPCSLAQFCETNAECSNGQCISQSCSGGAHVYLCGLQSAAPFNCVKQ